MDKKPEKLVPEVRFKGFTDDWEQRKLGETLTGFEYGLNTPATDYDGINKYLRITDIDDISHKFDTSHLTSPKLKDDNYLLDYGDILFARTGASVGKSYSYSKTDGKVYYAGFLIKAHIKAHFSTNFIFNTTLLPRYHYFVQVTSMRSGQPGINAKEYQKYIIYTPSENEQNKISDLILTIQKLVDLQQRKLEQLKQLKKAMLQRLFADKNCKQPILRFKNFNGNWEQRKLKDVSVFENGRAYKQNELLEKGKYPVLRVGNFYTNDQWYYSNLELAKNKYANNGDLLYTWSATFGPHIWNGPKIIYHYHIWKIQISNRISKLFLYSFLEADKANLLNNTNGSTMIHITKSNMENKAIIYPKMEEQLKIGGISSLIENLITLHQNKLSQLTTFKKYLLQKLFI